MTEMMEKNLQKQIDNVREQIKQCNDEQFNSLIYKYNIFTNIKNSFDEEIIEINDFQRTLEVDDKILEKIYSKFLNVNIISNTITFDEVMLETFLSEVKQEEQELIAIFKKEYVESPKDNGMLPANSTILEKYSLQTISVLIDKGILQKRNCQGLAFEFTDKYLQIIKKEILEEKRNQIDYKKCKSILQLDFNSISDINKLQKYKVKLLDSYRFINNSEEYGQTIESLKRGFIVRVPELSYDSYIPTDKFMSVNIQNAIKNIDNRLAELYKMENTSKLESNTYRGIFYSVVDDCDENKGGYYIEFFKDLGNEYGEIDFDNRLDYMVIHIDNEDEMKNPRKYIEQHIDQLLLELEKEELEEEEEC